MFRLAGASGLCPAIGLGTLAATRHNDERGRTRHLAGHSAASFNSGGSTGTRQVTVVPVPGLEAIPLLAGAVVTVPLTDPSVLGTSIVVTSAQRLFVERLLGRGGDLSGRSGSFALSG